MIDTRKQSENGFSKGLVMDSHPINADNNSLQGCLNGTLVTFNGNEMILQNDMGNGKVETAYLPSGYVPVGMQEHGGIIYVASYNPETNHGQLGCFPSPERNISSDETGDSAKTISSSNFGYSSTNSDSNILYVKSLLSNTITVRPGDKFALVGSKAGVLTDGNYIVENGVTLKLMVRDNAGNFTDITDSVNPYVDSDNKEYLIQPEADAGSSLVYTIYKEKTSGELYLIAELPYIDDFEVSYTYDITDTTKTITFYISNQDNLETVILEDFPGYNGNSYIIVKNETLVDGNIELSTTSLSENINCSFTPCTIYSKMDSLKKTITIDVSSLENGVVSLEQWRYFNDLEEEILYINWGMQANLPTSSSVKSVTFEFQLWDESSGKYVTVYTYQPKSRISYNGFFQETIPYADGLTLGNLYNVKITYTKGTSTKSIELTNKSLYTSKYFNNLYNDSTKQDYDSEQINLKIGFDIYMDDVETDSKESAKTQSVYSTIFEAPTEHYKDENGTSYPFYYLVDNQETITQKIKVTPYLYYDGLGDDTFDLPVQLNLNSLQLKVSQLQDALSKSLDKGGLNLGITSTEEVFDNHKVQYSNPTITYNGSGEYSTIEGELFNVSYQTTLQTVSKFLAQQLATDITAAEGWGFRPYMHKENLHNILGYTPNVEGIFPYYAMYIRPGESDNNKARLDTGILMFDCMEHPNKGEDSLGSQTESGNLASDRTARLWKDQILAYIKKELKNLFTFIPNVFFLVGERWDIGGRQTDWGTTQLWNTFKSSTSEENHEDLNYSIVLWKGKDDDYNYYMLNQYFPRNDAMDGSTTITTTKGNALGFIYKIFSRLYTKQKFSQSGTIYKSDELNSVIIDDYTFSLSDELQFELTTKTEGDLLWTSNDVNLKNKKIENEEGEVDLINIEIDSLTTSIQVSSKAVSVKDIAQTYWNVSTSSIEGALYDDNLNLVLISDYQGNSFRDDTIYYIGYDKKAYPITDNKGWSEDSGKSELCSMDVNRSQLAEHFVVKYDNTTGMYHIRLNVGVNNAIQVNFKNTCPTISYERKFKFKDYMQGYLLNVELFKNPAYLIANNTTT